MDAIKQRLQRANKAVGANAGYAIIVLGVLLVGAIAAFVAILVSQDESDRKRMSRMRTSMHGDLSAHSITLTQSGSQPNITQLNFQEGGIFEVPKDADGNTLVGYYHFKSGKYKTMFVFPNGEAPEYTSNLISQDAAGNWVLPGQTYADNFAVNGLLDARGTISSNIAHHDPDGNFYLPGQTYVDNLTVADSFKPPSSSSS